MKREQNEEYEKAIERRRKERTIQGDIQEEEGE